MRSVTGLASAVLFAVATSAGVAEESVERGRELFTREWKSQTPNDKQGDGLGPYFNERSCAGCHKLGGVGGAGPNEKNVQLMILSRRAGEFDGRPAMRSPAPTTRVVVLHRESTLVGYDMLRLQRLHSVAPRNLEVHERFRPGIAFPDALRIENAYYEAATPTSFEERNTPALFGAGLIDSVSLETLNEVAELQSDDIRGRPARLPGGAVGRFGWKGQNATLADFCENACAVELGLETPMRHQTPAPFERRIPGVPFDGYLGLVVPDMTAREVLELTSYVASPPKPLQRPVGDREKSEADGEWLFASIGCATCHKPDLGDVTGIYSDLLLHNVGTSGAIYYNSLAPPEIVNGERIIPVAGGEFRTPPLWGVADGAPYLHDGSAPDLHQAILAHEGQAAGVRTAYIQLTGKSKQLLLSFLGSLRAPVIH